MRTMGYRICKNMEKGMLVFRFSGSERAALARHLNSFPIPYWEIGNKLIQ